MSGPAPEFSRLFRIDTIGGEARDVRIAAEPAECAALARRFGLEAIDRLEASARLRQAEGSIHADGRFEAAVVQSCVATGAPVAAQVAQDFTLRFVAEVELAAQDEIELDEADLDTIPYAGSAIDLGEAVAEELALALDPFPRAPDADAVLRAAGVVPEEEAAVGPFAGLKALKEKMGR